MNEYIESLLKTINLLVEDKNTENKQIILALLDLENLLDGARILYSETTPHEQRNVQINTLHQTLDELRVTIHSRLILLPKPELEAMLRTRASSAQFYWWDLLK